MARHVRSLDRDFISSLSHGLSVLEAVADSEGDISLVDLAQRVGFNKTSTWRLAHTLVELGYLEQNIYTRSFRPAARILALGFAYFDGLDLKQLSQPHLRELWARHNETVNLAVRNRDEVIYIDRISTSHIVSINLHVGSRLPLYCTSLGRTLISEMPEKWVEQYVRRVAGGAKDLTDIPPDYKKLMHSLAETRQLKYALNDEELVKGLRAISSPVRDRNAEIVAAVCISVPSSRVTVSDLRRFFAPDVIEVAEKISLALGYRPEKSVRETSRRRIPSKGKTR
jgi:IclR family transcriptional regulator, pca regulon regulatory protein